MTAGHIGNFSGLEQRLSPPLKIDASKITAREYCKVHGLWKR